MLRETKEIKGPGRRASGFVIFVSERCTRSPVNCDAWRAVLAPLLGVLLLGEAADTVKVKRLEALALGLLVGGELVLDGLEANAAFANADDDTAARGTLAVGVVFLGEGESDFGNAAVTRLLGVVDEVLLLLKHVDGFGGSGQDTAVGRADGRGRVALLVVKRKALLLFARATAMTDDK